MDDATDPIDTVYRWCESNHTPCTPEKYATLQEPVRQVIAVCRVDGLVNNGAFPSVIYNEHGYMLRDAIAGLRVIDEHKLAETAEAYADAIEANPYLGPPEIWSAEVAPEVSSVPEDESRLRRLDDTWFATSKPGRLYMKLAKRIREIDDA